jgi:hypothetical protein
MKIPLNVSKEEEEEGDDVEDLMRRGIRKFLNVKLCLLKSLGNQLGYGIIRQLFFPDTDPFCYWI